MHRGAFACGPGRRDGASIYAIADHVRCPCQRFARNGTTLNLVKPYNPILDSAFHLRGCVATRGAAWRCEPAAHRWHARGQGFKSPQLHHESPGQAIRCCSEGVGCRGLLSARHCATPKTAFCTPSNCARHRVCSAPRMRRRCRQAVLHDGSPHSRGGRGRRGMAARSSAAPGQPRRWRQCGDRFGPSSTPGRRAGRVLAQWRGGVLDQAPAGAW
jgi:hypothetical protein